MFSCLQILEAFLWFVLITLLNVTLIILTLSVSRLLNLLLRLVAFLLFLHPPCLASISRCISASSSWNRFRHFICKASIWIGGICVLSAIRVLRPFFFFQAEDGIRDVAVTGVQTCALPICAAPRRLLGDLRLGLGGGHEHQGDHRRRSGADREWHRQHRRRPRRRTGSQRQPVQEIGRASCRERV